MTKEELYVKLLHVDRLNEIDFWDIKKHSKNYEISELILRKFNSTIEYYYLDFLNKQAVSNWLHAKTDISLRSHFKGVGEVLPETIRGSLYLMRTNIIELPNLKRVEGDIDLSYSKIRSLPSLEFVGGNLILDYSEISILDNLKTVKGNLEIKHSFLRRLPSLEEVRGPVLVNPIGFWASYFRKTGRPEISEKCSYQQTSWKVI